MTPAERAVIALAERWADADATIDSDRIEDAAEALQDAVAALRAERAERAEIPWGRVVADDQVWSAKWGKFVRVLEIFRDGDAVRFRVEGMAKHVTMPAAQTVKVVRCELGKVADMFGDGEIVSSR